MINCHVVVCWTSDVRIRTSRIRIRIQALRIRIQLNPNPSLFSWIRIRIRIQLLWIRIRIRIQLVIELKFSRAVIGTRNLESGFESESESTLFLLNPNPDSYILALNPNPNPNPNPALKALNPDSNPNPDSHITVLNWHEVCSTILSLKVEIPYTFMASHLTIYKKNNLNFIINFLIFVLKNSNWFSSICHIPWLYNHKSPIDIIREF